MKELAIVALGGGLGAACRYELGGWVLHHAPSNAKFPFSTLAVNLLGCFVAGLLAGMVERREWFAADVRLFLFTGLLGGFTTFSAFGLDAVTLLRRGEWLVAGSYVGLSVFGGLVLFAVGGMLVWHRSPAV